jgi:hypothetical protein
LALCDYRSVVPEQDTFPVALIFPEREGETLGVQPSLKYRWKYLRGMAPDEFVLIKWFVLFHPFIQPVADGMALPT